LAHLRNDDFISPDELSRLHVSGAWILNTDSYDDSERFQFSLPTTWELKGTVQFEQDYLWERPVVVQHFRIRRSTD